MINKRQPRHPGGLIKRQYLEPLKITITDFADIIGVSRKTVSEIVNERASVSPDMALRLSVALQTTPELWLNLQQKYDLWCAANESEFWKEVAPLDVKAQPESNSTVLEAVLKV
ncbi:HigA family addiction module antidote protein [Fortiea sp. LEGE XX443]|uniref:HigA family addiction module antitoxin n=1 Tax=Fortiea sp. LEGE XX443 TaxID=1828611 RepID=UPI00187DE514|nr:HigA family addiction module antitoxin [Fortiea sp. LEGE XX443]MBE9008375.1 HigA family addiction module antidote protein [Fortiea sp. LEGE XX443]